MYKSDTAKMLEWFRKHPGYYSIGWLHGNVPELELTKSQIATATEQLVKRGRISRWQAHDAKQKLDGTVMYGIQKGSK